MPAAIAIPLIVGAVSAGASVYGAKKNADANKEASKTEAESADKALDFSKTVYNERKQQLTPYQEFGARSLGTLGDLLGIPAPKTNAPPMATDPNRIQSGQSFPASWVSGSPLSGTPQTAPGNGSPVGAPSGGMVTIQAPDGSRRAVPSGLQTFYVARGGTVV